MISQVLKYVLPIGATVVYLPTTVLAAGMKSSPASVYDEPQTNTTYVQPEFKETELEKLVGKCRQEIAPVKNAIKQYTSASIGAVKDTYGSAIKNIHYIRNTAPEEARIGTVVAGGFLGILAGVRRGMFRKLFYGAIAATGGAYVAYPKDTVHFISNGIPAAQKYANIAYNFVVGVEPQDKLSSSSSGTGRK